MKISHICYTQDLKPKAEHRRHHHMAECGVLRARQSFLDIGHLGYSDRAQSRITDQDLKPRPGTSSMLLEGKLLCFCAFGDFP